MHVLTVPGGFGLRLIPFAPFRARTRGPNVVEIERTGNTFGSVRVVAAPGGHHRIEAVSGDPAEVVSIEAGPEDERWLIQTSRVTLAFPAGYTLLSVPDGSTTPFDLVGEHGELIYMQTSRTTLSTSQLIGKGQTVTAQSDRLVELSYEHEGQPFYQRHQIIELANVGTFILTAQSPDAHAGLARVVLEELARSVRPT